MVTKATYSTNLTNDFGKYKWVDTVAVEKTVLIVLKITDGLILDAGNGTEI
jgi:hypothetical protein